MAFNRHLGRIVALQTLYEYNFRRDCQDGKLNLDDVLNRNIERYKETIEDTEFIRLLVKGVIEHEAELTDKLQPIAPEWPLDQIARVDLTTLHIALYELLYAQDTPPKVVINEAVELSKAFGGENSSRFINGVLGTAYRLFLEKPTGTQDSTTSKSSTPVKPKLAVKKPAKKKL